MPRTTTTPLEYNLARELALSGEMTQADLVHASGQAQQKIFYWTRDVPSAARELYFAGEWAKALAVTNSGQVAALWMLGAGLARLDDVARVLDLDGAQARNLAKDIDWRSARASFCAAVWAARLAAIRDHAATELAAYRKDAWKRRIAFRADNGRLIIYGDDDDMNAEWERLNAGRTARDHGS